MFFQVWEFSAGGFEEIFQHFSALYSEIDRNETLHSLLLLWKNSIPSVTILDELEKLFTGTAAKSKNFRENIHQYITQRHSFYFVVLRPNYGPYNFRIHEMVHHRISLLHPKNLPSSSDKSVIYS